MRAKKMFLKVIEAYNFISFVVKHLRYDTVCVTVDLHRPKNLLTN